MNTPLLHLLHLPDAFWLTTWFKVVAAALLLVGAYVVFRIKIHAERSEQARLRSKLHECDELLFYSRDNEKKAKEEALNTHKATGKLLARISHEIRTPMNGVLGMTGMLAGTALTKEQSDYLESIRSCSDSMMSSINEIMLNFSVGNPIGVREMEPRNKPTITEGMFSSNIENIEKLSDQFARQYPMRILVGEDNQMNQQLLIMILKRLGYEADISVNGKELLQMASEKTYELIFMDVQMPEMDGLEATHLIRLRLSVQPVIIAMTANAMTGDREECLRAGMDDYISKPIHFDELLRKLEKWALHIQEKV